MIKATMEGNGRVQCPMGRNGPGCLRRVDGPEPLLSFDDGAHAGGRDSEMRHATPKDSYTYSVLPTFALR
jgi:hypothetical protein